MLNSQGGWGGVVAWGWALRSNEGLYIAAELSEAAYKATVEA
jgi:hypothetical protein